jgi:hypothetical protein
VGLKRLMEVVRDGGGTLAVVLAGHPKLKNDLRRPSMEEIGSRATVFELEGFGGEKRQYVQWLLSEVLTPKAKLEAIITAEALSVLSDRLTTPLQFEQYLTLAFEQGYKVGQKPVGAEVIDTVLAKDLDGLEPRLARQGYNVKALADLLNAKPAEVRSFLRGKLPPSQTQEFQNEIRAAGIPL